MSRVAARRLALGGLLVASFAAGLVALDAVLPPPQVPHVSLKLAELQRRHDRVDVLFFGSSRVYRHLSPRRFDAELHRRGFELRSFNCGVPAMQVGEALFLLERWLPATGVRPRLVLIEPDGLAMEIHSRNARSIREIYWHDLDRTRLALATGPELATAGARWARRRNHLIAGLEHQLAAGRLRGPLGRWLGILEQGEADDVGDVLGPGGDGFQPFDLALWGEHPHHRAFRDRLGRFRRQVRRLQERSPRQVAAWEIALLERLQRAVEALGATPIFVLSPVTRERDAVHEAHRRGVVRWLLAFDDPERYPRLYRPALRYDRGHLDARGADLYTRLVAAEVAALLAAEPRLLGAAEVAR